MTPAFFLGNWRRSFAMALRAAELIERTSDMTGLTYEEIRAEVARRVVVYGISTIDATEDVMEDAASGCWPPPVS